jgi:hypothetical protein
MGVEAASLEVQRLGDVAHRRRRIAALAEECGSGVLDLLPARTLHHFAQSLTNGC